MAFWSDPNGIPRTQGTKDQRSLRVVTIDLNSVVSKRANLASTGAHPFTGVRSSYDKCRISRNLNQGESFIEPAYGVDPDSRANAL